LRPRLAKLACFRQQADPEHRPETVEGSLTEANKRPTNEDAEAAKPPHWKLWAEC